MILFTSVTLVLGFSFLLHASHAPSFLSLGGFSLPLMLGNVRGVFPVRLYRVAPCPQMLGLYARQRWTFILLVGGICISKVDCHAAFAIDQLFSFLGR